MGCPACQVFPSNLGLTQVSWYKGQISLTLHTVSVVVTQYNNSAVTSTTTILGDLNALNASTISEAMSIATSILANPTGQMNNDYPGLGAGVIFASGTDGAIGGGASIPYPTPYVIIDGFYLTTQTSGPPGGACTTGPIVYTSPWTTFTLTSNGPCTCSLTNYQPNPPDWATTTLMTLSDTYYAPITFPAATTTYDYFMTANDGDNFLPLNNVSFSNFLASDTSLMSAYPGIKSCFYIAEGFGPPALKIPVSALTATTTATVKGSSRPTSQSPKPASPVANVEPAPTMKAPAPTFQPPASEPVPFLNPMPVPQVTAEVSHELPQGTPAANQASKHHGEAPNNSPQPGTSTKAATPNGGEESQSSPQNPLPSSKEQGVVPQSSPQGATATAAAPAPVPGNSQENQPQPQFNAAPAIPFHGSIIQPDLSSHYNLPGIGSIRPGGAPVTTNNVVYSLAAPATAIISNGNTIALTPIPSPASLGKPNLALTFAGSTYTPDSLSNIIIAGQTLKPGSPAVTVSNTPISLAPEASVAVIGGSTQSLRSGPAPTEAPVLTYGGSTYTVSSSAFVIGSQTLTPGGLITVSGTPISLATGASVAVIGSSTQSLGTATITPAPSQQAPILTFAGATFTADSSSAFVIAGQTLTPGGQITVSGTPISLAPGATVAVIGSSTGALATATIAAGETETAREITFGDSTYTANAASDFVIAGQTLTPGGVITVSGTRVSYGAAGTDVVVGSSTEPVGLATYIMGGFGPSSTAVEGFTGGAGVLAPRWSGFLLLGLGLFLVMA